MDIRAHAKEVRVKREELDLQFPGGYLYVATIANRLKGTTPGGISEVSVANAAEGIVNRVLRIAGADEIDAYHKRNQATREVILRGQQARDPKSLAVSVERRS